MSKKWLAYCFIVTLVFTLWNPQYSKAASKNVSVTLPAFPVELNGVLQNHEKLRYPFLTYKDITYVPMTWTISQITGLSLNWSDSNGLDVGVSGNPLAVEPELESGGSFQKGKKYTAQVVDYPVAIYGQAIDNTIQTFPLLSFQDVTYFPLTWDYAVEKFRWNLQWSSSEGFKITTNQRSYINYITYEDETNLYAYAGNSKNRRFFQIPKSLNGTPVLLSSEKSKELQDSLSSNGPDLGPELSLDAAKSTIYKEHGLWYNDQLILPLEKWEEGNALFRNSVSRTESFTYSESIYDLDVDTKVFMFAIPKSFANPLMYGVFQYQIVILDHGKVIEVSDFDKQIQAKRLTDAGTWFWTGSSTSLSTRSIFGNVLWIGKDGSSKNWASILNAQCVRVLKAEDSKLLVQAYELYRDTNTKKQTGYFWIHNDGTFEKIADLTASKDPVDSPFLSGDNLNAFVDNQSNIYVIQNNRITNVNSGVSKMWWDYELRAQVKDDPIGGYLGE